MRRNRLAIVLASWAFLYGLSALPARAQNASADEEARVHFRLGRAYYDSGRFPEAAREFEDAYRLSNRAQLLYNIFVAHRDAGNLEAAADALRRYLDLVPNAEDRESLRARLASMERLLAERTVTPPRREQTPPESQLNSNTAQTPPPQRQDTATPTPPPTAPVPTPTPPVQTERSRTAPEPALETPASSTSPSPTPSSSGGPSPVSFAFMGVGGAMMIGGAVTGVMANDTSARISSMCPNRVCPESLRGDVDSGRTLALTTDILLFGGLGVAATGVILLFALPNEGAPDVAPTPSVSCALDGCVGSLSGRF